MGNSNTWKKRLGKINRVGLDTMVFIYEFAKHKKYFPLAHEVFLGLEKGRLKAVTSLVSFIEVCSLPALEGNEELLKVYKEVFLKTPNLEMVNPDWEIADKTAELRRVYKLRTPDAMQVATAMSRGAKVVISNDQKLKKVKGVEVWVLGDFV
jgi:predicted nucleic acid-binding protein